MGGLCEWRGQGTRFLLVGAVISFDSGRGEGRGECWRGGEGRGERVKATYDNAYTYMQTRQTLT